VAAAGPGPPIRAAGHGGRSRIRPPGPSGRHPAHATPSCWLSIEPTDLTSFIGRRGTRIVEPGRIELRLGPSSEDTPIVFPIELTGPERTIEGARQMTAKADIF
jgi:hypothetical protein